MHINGHIYLTFCFVFREEVIVSIPLHKENFQKLPNNLQKGERIKIIPILFNVGINEHATIAERYFYRVYYNYFR